MVARTEDLPDATLDPLHRLLGWRGSQVLIPILPVPHRPKGVAQEGKRLAPPIAHPGLLLVERQPHLGEPSTTLREHLRSPRATQDHLILGFEHLDDAGRFLAELRARLAKFQLELHPDKARLIEFGRFAVAHHQGRGGVTVQAFQAGTRVERMA